MKTLDLPISLTVGPVRIHVIVAAGLSIWLLLPAAAHTTAGLGLKALSRGDVNRALDLYTWAKTAAPYNPYYYWTLGVIWKDQAIALKDQSAAVRADGLFAEGFAIDPNFELNPKQRLKLHRDHPGLLPEPARRPVLSRARGHRARHLARFGGGAGRICTDLAPGRGSSPGRASLPKARPESP